MAQPARMAASVAVDITIPAVPILPARGLNTVFTPVTSPAGVTDCPAFSMIQKYAPFVAIVSAQFFVVPHASSTKDSKLPKPTAFPKVELRQAESHC